MQDKLKKADLSFTQGKLVSLSEITWREYSLSVSFTDSFEYEWTVVFDDVEHFGLRSEDEVNPDLFPPDGVVGFVDSSVIGELVGAGNILEDESNEYNHIMIGFEDSCVYLEVLFREFEAKRS